MKLLNKMFGEPEEINGGERGLAYAVAGLCRAVGSLSCRVAHIGAVLQDDFLCERRQP